MTLPSAPPPSSQNAFELVRYPEGAHIITQGDQDNAMYLLLEGTVKVVLGDDEVLGNLTPGEEFGENGLIASRVRTANIVANEAVTVCAIHQDRVVAAVGDAKFAVIVDNFNNKEKEERVNRLTLRKQVCIVSFLFFFFFFWWWWWWCWWRWW